MDASVISFFTADIIANGVFTAQKTCQEWGGGGGGPEPIEPSTASPVVTDRFRKSTNMAK